MPERRSERLFAQASGWRAACLAHPFVAGLADGSLPPEAFGRWIVQDWIYLQTYVEVLEVLARAAPSRASQWWRDAATLTRDEELALHRGLARTFGLTAAELDAAAPLPATEAYTGFLCESAALSYAHGVAAICPCGVGYLEIARALDAGPACPEPRYAAWIQTYNDPAFARAVGFMTDELDAAEGDEAALAATYLRGAEHELLFWSALWDGPAAATR